ncbi:hypothetical protein Pmani_035922 [Petrolisthes manimaculis]|uniref:Uncharacterized protein n=1 Tax=Petrolisthes manimaculis TaxID=1843537 RepID=A0AAE1NKS6_9EUCA|nr:hypothetical protein Pmani_035922 [Petrolisthes manimaculis]
MLREGEVTGYTRHDVSERSDVFLKAAAFEETLTTIRQAGVKKQANFVRGVNTKFLSFIISRVDVNSTDRYPHFPFLSLCGRERNYIRCDDLPIVYTHIEENKGEYSLTYNHTGGALKTPFQPSQLCMEGGTGRVYHPAPSRVGGVGLVRSKLALQLAPHFLFHGEGQGKEGRELGKEGKEGRDGECGEGEGEEEVQLPSHIVWCGEEDLATLVGLSYAVVS